MHVEFNDRLQGQIDDFAERIFTDPLQVVDPEGVQHHEFVSGNHGYKVDFDVAPDDSDFFMEWMGVYARAVREVYADRMPDAVVGIANGANRIARVVGAILGVRALETEKVSKKEVKLTPEAREAVKEEGIFFALTVEDVGSTGGTTVTAVNDLREAGVRRIESVNGLQRSLALPSLVEARVPHWAVIERNLGMFSAEECALNGLCAQGVPLIPHGA
jgi:hypoxanthine phosphoribosyltransferase